jgi:protein tyrosine/serine phosphatase
VITLRTVAKILETDETQHVIFHCRNGKHRAAFGILALLQLHYKMSYEDAMDALSAGTANHGGWPPVELDKVKPFLWEWLEKELQP